jgi:hypothetical protein
MSSRLLRLGYALYALAVLGISGGHWAVFQAVAWSRMLVQNSRGGELTEAVIKTFDGQHPCDLCRQIEKGRKAEQKPELQMHLVKLTLFHAQAEVVLVPPREDWLWGVDDVSRNARGEQPRLEPPRAAVG